MKGPRLVRLGLALMVAGLAFPRGLQTLMEGMEPGFLRSALSVLTQALHLGFVAGLVLAVIGIVRHRKALRG